MKKAAQYIIVIMFALLAISFSSKANAAYVDIENEIDLKNSSEELRTLKYEYVTTMYGDKGVRIFFEYRNDSPEAKRYYIDYVIQAYADDIEVYDTYTDFDNSIDEDYNGGKEIRNGKSIIFTEIFGFEDNAGTMEIFVRWNGTKNGQSIYISRDDNDIKDTIADGDFPSESIEENIADDAKDSSGETPSETSSDESILRMDIEAWREQLEHIVKEHWNNAAFLARGSIYVIEIPILELGYEISIDDGNNSEITLEFLNSISDMSLSEIQEGWDSIVDSVADLSLSIYDNMGDFGIEEPTAVIMIVDNAGDNNYDDIYTCTVNGTVVSNINEVRHLAYVICNESNLKTVDELESQSIKDQNKQYESLSSEYDEVKSELEAKIKKLSEENKELKQQIKEQDSTSDETVSEEGEESLAKKNEKYREQIETLRTINKNLAKKNGELEAEIRQLKAELAEQGSVD